MTNNSSLFCKLDSSIKVPVRMGNGAVIQSTRKGTIGVQTKKGMKYINDVLLVPGLNESLLGVAQMFNNGYSFVFENNHCTLIESNNKEIVKVPMENKSFLLKWNYPVENVNVANSSNTWLWHRSNKKIMINRDVEFDEDASWNWEEEKVEKKFFQVDSEVHDKPRDGISKKLLPLLYKLEMALEKLVMMIMSRLLEVRSLSRICTRNVQSFT
uniref:Retrovirus-related Pol polyprotein from transposon TNT 1-94-like beta-barrel domain-containing protein n=1 Tax=Chenopodium quinoa TaxID=63459 RepID=A0A803L1P1_CHEQI